MHHPLLIKTASDTDWVITANGALTQGQFLARVQRLAALLPDRQYAINLCEDRLNFMSSFAAVLTRGQTLLLPSNRSPGAIAEIADEYADCYFLSDGLNTPEGRPTIHVHELGLEGGSHTEVLDIPADAEVAIVFTSGSTGRAQPNLKTWGSLVRGSALAQDRFNLLHCRHRASPAYVWPGDLDTATHDVGCQDLRRAAFLPGGCPPGPAGNAG